MRALSESIGPLYEHDGPFVTVYFDATRTSESGVHEVELRWQELRSELSRQGATENDLQLLDDAVAEPDEIGGPHGRVLLAAGGEVLLDARLPEPPARPHGAFGPVPDLVPLVAAAAPAASYVLVVADHTGADVTGVPAELAAAGRRPSGTSVTGSRPYPVHKTGRNEWSERHFQNRVENSWSANAKDVAAEVAEAVASVDADLVLVAGDPHARSLLRADIPAVVGPATDIVDLEAGSRADGASEEALDHAVREALLHYAWRKRREVLEHLQQNLGRGRYAVAGVADVVAAVRRSQADTVVLSDDPSSTLTAWIGPEPLQVGLSADELTAMGVSEPEQVRFDAALLRAVAGSGGRLVVTPNAHDYVPDGIAALLRYDGRAEEPMAG